MGFVSAVGTFDVVVNYSTSMYVCMYVILTFTLALEIGPAW